MNDTPNYIWTDNQQAGIGLIEGYLQRPYDPNKPFIYIAGFAGTGKTTLVEFALRSTNKHVAKGTVTGKAASVMRRKGNANAQTIHSMCYELVPQNMEEIRKLRDERSTLRKGTPEYAQIQRTLRDISKLDFRLREEPPAADAILLDEVSMVGEQMGRDLLSFKKPIIVLGDPGQLPPIEGEGFFTKGKPDIFLTEIHRQAEGNPIIQLATQARNKQKLQYGTYGQSRIIAQGAHIGDELLKTNQCIAGKNATRQKMNKVYRHISRYTDPYPMVGERVICLKNTTVIDLDDPGAKYGVRLFNGNSAEILERIEEMDTYITYIIRTEDGIRTKVDMHKAYFDDYSHPGAVKNLTPYDLVDIDQFDFGYCITTHKAQGSQWDNVLIFDDKMFIWDRDTRAKWLYTGITRAAETLTIAQ